MKVLLINPPQPIFNGVTENLAVSWPMGILYVAAAVERAGYNVRILDAYIGGCTPFVMTNGNHNVWYTTQMLQNRRDGFTEDGVVGLTNNLFKGMIAYEEPDVVGISLMFSSIHHTVPMIVRLVKEAVPNAMIVLGGAHASIAASSLLEIDGVDYVITGEGEVAFPHLLRAIENHEPTDNIPGVYPTPFEVIPNIDDIYPPAYHMVPIDQYFAVLGHRELVMITSRGCPFSCRFCSVPQSSHRTWRAHSVGRVLAEMEIAKTMGATDIMFEDDNISLNKGRYCSILEGVIQQNWNLGLGARNILLTTLDKDVLTLMKRAGFTKVPVSAESGCDRVLAEEMGKKLTIAETERVVRESVEVGLKPFLNFVLGMPGEKWSEIEQTAGFARRMKTLGAEGFWVSVATPIYGTKMFQELVDKDMLPKDFTYQFSYGRATFDGLDWTKEQLQGYRKMLMVELNS